MRRPIVLLSLALAACGGDVSAVLPPPGPEAPDVTVIDAEQRIGFVEDGVVQNDWIKYQALPALDGRSAVLYLSGMGTGGTRVTWLTLPAGDVLGDLDLVGVLEPTATSLDGGLAAFVNRAGDAPDGTIAGAREASRIVVASPTDGVVYETELEGNFVPEAFGRATGTDGIPDQVFLLEYLPADTPTVYRVRVLSTATGELSLPLNLRNKIDPVDQEMAGYTRSQVVSADDGLLFTLYVGTDGMPDGHPHAFVHTLDFADGVWCLVPDDELDLAHLPGALAVGGDRLYVGSANGWVGSFPIPAITDIALDPVMDWSVQVHAGTDRAPVMTADADGVTLAYGDRLIEVGPDGQIRSDTGLSAPATAMSATGDMVGDRWATFGDFERPDWMSEITRLFVSP